MNSRLDRSSDLLTSDEIVDRAAWKAESWRYICRWCAAASVVILIGITEPMHSWLHHHLELLLGFLLGALAQTVPWVIDRWRWMKWFSYQ